jgi:hypothetical protein
MTQTQEGKALGPDGFTADFFHLCWNFIKEDVWKLVEESRKMLGVLPTLNSTFITLILKEKRSLTLKSFHPISLCNVILKIITKALANRLKPLLSMLISKKQNGYVEGQKILDNIILTQERIHSLKLNKSPSMLIKLDMSKAFEKISW